MEKTGLIDNPVYALASANWRYRQRIEESKPFKVYATGLNEIYTELKVIGTSNDIDKILENESILIDLEREQHLSKDSSVMSSLDAAIKDFDDIRDAVSIVKSTESYQAAAKTYRSNKKVHGVVANGCHEAMNGHIARLSNRIRTVGVSVPEKNVLRQRQANMRIAKDLYIDLQCKALSIESPSKSKSKGLEL